MGSVTCDELQAVHDSCPISAFIQDAITGATIQLPTHSSSPHIWPTPASGPPLTLSGLWSMIDSITDPDQGLNMLFRQMCKNHDQ